MRSLALTLTMILGLAASAQQRDQVPFRDRPATLSAGLEIGIPSGDFNNTWGREIVGFSGNIALPMRLLPFDWGFDFAYGRMGGDGRSVPVSANGISATTGEMTVNSNVLGYHGIARFKPITGKISPYVEGLAGLRQFTTRTTVRVDGMDQIYSRTRNTNNFVGSTGWAVGLQVTPTRAFYLEGRVERLYTGRATYVDPRSISINSEGTVNYTTLSSATDAVNVHIGIGIRF